MCGTMEIGCQIKEGFLSVATSALDNLRDESSKAALSTLRSATLWLTPKTPTLADNVGEKWTNSPTVEFLQHNLLYVTGSVFVVAVLIAGVRVAWEQRARPLQQLLKAMLTFVVVGAAGTATMQALVTWSDEFAVSIVHDAMKDQSLAASFGGQLDPDGVPQTLVAAGVPALISISISTVVMVSYLIQIVLMLVRSAMLVLLAGTFPLAAAATNTELGTNWFRKYCGWSLAFIAYKPAAALVYAASFKLSQANLLGGGDDVIQAMTGMMMLLLAIFALPALLRFMVPVTAAVAGGSAGVGSAVADPGGVATGAINVARGGFGGGSGGGGGSSSGGGGASGARTVGAAATGAAGAGLAAARKVGGGIAGAAAHSSGEAGGGSVTPASASGPMAGRGRSRPSKPSSRSHSSSASEARVPEPAGPSGNW